MPTKENAGYRFAGDNAAYGCRNCRYYDEVVPSSGKCAIFHEQVQADYLCNLWINPVEHGEKIFMSNETYAPNDSYIVDALAKKYMKDHAVPYKEALHAVVREASKDESRVKSYQQTYNSFLDKTSHTAEEVKHFAGVLLHNLAELDLARKYTSREYASQVKQYLRESPALAVAYERGFWDREISRAVTKFLDERSPGSHKFESKTAVFKSY